MAFTIVSQPTNLQPVHNDLTFRVYEASLYASSNFKYNFYTYVNGVLVNTSKLYPRPDGYCNFNPSSIIRQYISRNFFYNLTSFSEASSNEVIKYKVVMKYEYETAGVLNEYSGNTGTDKYAWNSVAQWKEAQSISTYVSNYMPSVATPMEALNYIYKGINPGKGIELYDGIKNYISFFRRDAAGTAVAYFFDVYVNCRNGNHKQYTLTLPAATTTANSYIFHMPIGIAELNGITWQSTVIPSGMSSLINYAEDYGMMITVKDSNSDPVSESYYFTFLESDCPRRDLYTIAYQTESGSYGYIYFNQAHYKVVSNEKTIYDKVKPYNYSALDRVSTVYGEVSNRSFTLNSDWVMERDKVNEYRQMISSPDIWLIDKDNNMTPVFIDKYTFNENSVAQDKLFNYSIQFSSAFRENNLI